MFLRFAWLLALLTAACEAPSFGIAPVDPCAEQMSGQGKICGGACPICELGAACADATDCASGACTGGICATPPPPAACDDGLKNGDETDVDCGGSCSACIVDQHCGTNDDCTTLVCADVCQPPNCTDGVRNGTESAVDCGGSCTGCAVGASCTTGTDCATGSCSKGACLASTCLDKLQNGDETDVDCGGSCSPCTATQACVKGTDCDSLTCAATKRCTAPTCTDGIKNGTETDVDCGSGCDECKAAQTCKLAADCSTGLCKSGYCLPTAASGGVLVRTGWTATATASTGNTTPGYALDGDPGTRWSSGTRQVIGMYYEIDLQKPQIFYGFTLDSSDTPGDAAGQFDVYLSLDGTFSTAALTAQMSSVTTGNAVVSFTSAQIARYIKIVITKDESPNWWGIRELNVNN
jgi:hypothetical protein